MQALNVMQSSPADPELKAFVSDTSAEFNSLSTSELKDLGDALAHILSASPSDAETRVEQTPALPIPPLSPSSVAGSCSPGEDKASSDIDVVGLSGGETSPENGALLEVKSPPASSDSEDEQSTTDEHVKKNGKIIKLPQSKKNQRPMHILYVFVHF